MMQFGWTSLVLSASPAIPVLIVWWLYRMHQLQLVSLSLLCSMFFSILSQGLVSYLAFRFLSVLFWGPLRCQNPLFGRFSVFCFCWLSLGNPFISQMKFEGLIFQETFCVVHIPFVRMVKFKLLAQFPVDHLAYAVVSTLIFFLC